MMYQRNKFVYDIPIESYLILLRLAVVLLVDSRKVQRKSVTMIYQWFAWTSKMKRLGFVCFDVPIHTPTYFYLSVFNQSFKMVLDFRPIMNNQYNFRKVVYPVVFVFITAGKCNTIYFVEIIAERRILWWNRSLSTRSNAATNSKLVLGKQNGVLFYYYNQFMHHKWYSFKKVSKLPFVVFFKDKSINSTLLL